MTIDPRIAARRRRVIEGAARRSLQKFMRWLMVAMILGALIWFAQSPLFQVKTLSVFGVSNSDTNAVLDQAGVVKGRPLILVRPARVEEALREDPWVADATIGVVFPDRVEVVIVERSAAAWIDGGPIRLLVAEDGTVLPGAGFEEPLPTVHLDGIEEVAVGEVVPDDRARGAVLFLAVLDPVIAARGEITEAEGELWFDLPGMRVRLGRPIEMAEKAAALTALIERGVPADAVVHLVAPTRPAIETSPEPTG